MDKPICVITEEHAYLDSGRPRCSVSTVLAFEGDDADAIIDGMIERFVSEYYEGSDESVKTIAKIVKDAQETYTFEREGFRVDWFKQTFYV